MVTLESWTVETCGVVAASAVVVGGVVMAGVVLVAEAMVVEVMVEGLFKKPNEGLLLHFLLKIFLDIFAWLHDVLQLSLKLQTSLHKGVHLNHLV